MAHSSFLRVCIIVSTVLIGITAANAKTVKKKVRVAQAPKVETVKAANAKAVKKMVKVAQAPKVETVSAIPIVSPGVSPCRKIRRRLWIEDQGWVVRQASICD
jgi:hypothetical protein